jgi:membrane-associated PAP2 superfamily phosphatase
MSREAVARARWWLTRVALPVLALGALAVALGSSDFDARSLEPFYDAERRTFPLRDSWFFNGVVHLGGKYLVIAVAASLLVIAIFGLLSARWKAWSGRFA